jgi:hypothetical protein
MNRVRMILFAGVLGASGFGTSLTQAQSVTSAPTRRVAYAQSGGDHDRGSSSAAPQPDPLSYGRSIDPAPVRSHTPSWARTVRHRVGSSYDPSGRHDGLARPWLK